jgi:polyisoprenoid-binding protein YceI
MMTVLRPAPFAAPRRAAGRRSNPRQLAGLGLLAGLGAALLAAPTSAQDVHTIDSGSAPAGAYTLDPAHSSVTMRVSHFGLSYATLRFDKIAATLDYDPAHPEASKLQVTIDPASVDTGDEALNRQIAADLFETGKYPEIRFVSTSVKPTIEGRGQVSGDLTFHGVTKPVDLDILFNGAGQDPQHQTRLGFSANATIQRSQFGVAKYRPAAGDDVSVDIEVEFKK